MRHLCIAIVVLTLSSIASADDNRLKLKDVFGLEYASDPQTSPSGKQVVYVRNFMDIMKDRRRSNLWIINSDGTDHRALTTGNRNDHSPRWSPDGKRLVYVSGADKTGQLFCRWLDTGNTAQLTHVTTRASNPVWSPNGKHIAFTMLVPEKVKPLVELPAKPKGADWAAPPKVIRKVLFRHDQKGYLPDGYHHIFTIPAEGGTPRQVTKGSYHHPSPPVWSPDGKSLIFSANRSDNWEYEPRNTEVYEVTLDDLKVSALTGRNGPDAEPTISPDGKTIAYVGYDDRKQGYQVTGLYVTGRDGKSRLISKKLDRSVRMPQWGPDGKGIYFLYDDQGTTKIGWTSPLKTVAVDVGGTTIGRPYASGTYSVSRNGTVAFTMTSPAHPADVAVRQPGAKTRRLTRLNQDLFGHKKLGQVEEMWFKSSFDGRKIHGWLVKPPDFDAGKKYPLILEIHGGPFANYGSRFSTEMQLYVAAGYVVLYVNPRGSTGYGGEFGNLIHHKYPGNDYDDLMSGVDAAIGRGFIDKNNLFVTGGSGGGVLSSWTIGKTNRFRGAVVCKPVINWYSFVLTADVYPFFAHYWFPARPWEKPEEYLKRSSISLVGNVKTPTMLITGEQDYRTPMSQSEQFYQALKLRKVETVLVRVPGAAHHIAKRPSHLMAKAAYVLKWFEMHKQE